MAVRIVRADWSARSFRDLVAVVNQLVTLANELKADHNGAMTKLDADAGVTDTNYNATRAVGAADADTIYVGW